jgi:hypothetical protein
MKTAMLSSQHLQSMVLVVKRLLGFLGEYRNRTNLGAIVDERAQQAT